MNNNFSTLERKILGAEWKLFGIFFGVLCLELIFKVHDYKGGILAVVLLLVVNTLSFLYFKNWRSHE